jgi:hypothetical protein
MSSVSRSISRLLAFDAGTGGLLWRRHRDRLLAGPDAVLLHVERLA